MPKDSSPQESSNPLSRRKFLATTGVSVAALGLGVLNSGTLQSGFPSANLVSGKQINADSVSAKQINVDSVSAKQVTGIVPPGIEKGKGMYVDVEGNQYQRSGVWIKTNATAVDTLVGLFVENVGLGDGIYVENTKESNQASGIAVVNRADSIGLNCLQDSTSTFLQILKDPKDQGPLGDLITFGDLIAFKDLALGPTKLGSFKRIDERTFWIGGDGRMRTRVGIGSAEGLQLRGSESVPSGSSLLSVNLEVPEPDLRYGVVATPFWDTTLYVSNKTQTGFTLNFGTMSPGSEVSWIVFRDAL